MFSEINLIGEETYLGKFNISSGAVKIGDPCYDPDTWCLGDCVDVMDGTWVAKILEADDFDTNGWGDRNSALFAFNQDYFMENYNFDDIEIKRFAKSAYKTQFSLDYNVGELGVDSEQAGIYDHKNFLTVKQGEKAQEENWFWQNGNITLTGSMAGVHPDQKGCVSSSGFGDGGYDYFCYYNNQGYTVAILIVFISKEDFSHETI